MTPPAVGLQIMHNGRALELLYRVTDLPKDGGQVWRAKMLFVDAPDQDVIIRPTDECRALHSERKCRRAA